MVQRLIISPSTDFNTFVIGSTAPSSNQGPWLKDCLEWFVFDDATASYIPTLKGGFDNQQYNTANGTFTVPDFIYKIRVHAWGAGAGGSTSSGGVTKGGSGAGGYCCKIFDVTPGQMISYNVGAGGAAGAPGGAGGATTFLTLTASGGVGGSTTAYGTAGGAATGGDINITGQPGDPGFSGAGGSGGSSPQGGGGGTFIDPSNTAISSGKVPGGGGCGAYDVLVAGAGAGGGVLIEW